MGVLLPTRITQSEVAEDVLRFGWTPFPGADGCCDHRAMIADEDLHGHAVDYSQWRIS